MDETTGILVIYFMDLQKVFNVNNKESDKRLANKLIVALHNKEISGDAWHAINRTINRERRDPNDNGKRYTNGYLVFSQGLLQAFHSSCQSYSITVLRCIARKRCTRTPRTLSS